MVRAGGKTEDGQEKSKVKNPRCKTGTWAPGLLFVGLCAVNLPQMLPHPVTASSIDWPQVGRALSAFITPMVAVIATYIAVQQFAINRRQYRLALFEKRMKVFNSTMTMIASVMRTANATLDQCFQFIQDTRDHEFLFGPEIGKFIDAVYKKGTALHAHVTAGGPASAAQQTEIMLWFSEQMKEARKAFLKYLGFRKP